MAISFLLKMPRNYLLTALIQSHNTTPELSLSVNKALIKLPAAKPPLRCLEGHWKSTKLTLVAQDV